MNKLMPRVTITYKHCHPWITRGFSNGSVHMNHLGFLLKYRYRSKGLGWSLRVCISDKLPGAANATGLAGTLGGPMCRAWQAVCGFFSFKLSLLSLLLLSIFSFFFFLHQQDLLLLAQQIRLCLCFRSASILSYHLFCYYSLLIRSSKYFFVFAIVLDSWSY